MEDRQLRIGVVLVAILLTLAAMVYFWEPSEEDMDPDATEPVWSVEKDEITRLEIDRADGRVVLQQRQDGWWLEEPSEEPASDAQVGYLLGELVRIEKGILLEDVDPEEFGLGDPPVAKVVVTVAEGETKSLVLGDEAPIGWRTYALAANGSVVAVAGTASERLQMDVEELKDPHVFRFPVEKVRRVVIESEMGVLDVSGQGRSWFVEGFTRADSEKVDDLIMGLREIRYDAFHEVDLIGISDAEYRVTLHLEEGEVGFAVGETAPDEGRFVRGDDGRAGWVDPGKLSLLEQGPKDVGDDQAFPLDTDADDRVEVVFGAFTFAASRLDDAWTADDVEESVVIDALAVLAAAGIHYRREAPPAPDETWGSVTITRGEELPQVVQIGQIYDGDYRVAQDEGGGAPYLVPIEDITAFAAALGASAEPVP